LYIIPSISIRKSIENYSNEDLTKVVNLNLRENIYYVEGIHSAFKRKPDGGRSEPSVYAATKAGVVQLAKTAAAELGKYNIRVNVIAPGIVDTQMSKHIKEG
jgi:NAD(P)-dependent dehydrogenase (short-subunit alcohol dehydrogenase family)